MASSSPVLQTESREEILNKLVNGYSGAQNLIDKLEFLKSLTREVLPELSLVELETKFLAKVIPQAYDSVVESLLKVACLLKTLNSADDDESVLQKVHALLQAVIGCIECLEGCIIHIGQFSNQLSITDVHSLPQAVIKTVRKTFAHCKESESLYGGYFQVFSEELSGLFKKTYQLQKVLMELIDKIQLKHDADEKEVLDMTEVCHQLLEICILISDVDTGLLVNTWKVLNRLVTKHKELLKNHLEVERIIRHLCESVEAKLMRCVSMASQHTDSELQTVAAADVKVLNKMLKVVRFLIGHLMHVVKDYEDYIDGCITDLMGLLVTLQSVVPPSISAPRLIPAVEQEISSSILVVVQPLLKILINNKSFASLVTREATVKSTTFNPFGFSRVLIAAAGLLPEVTEDIFTHWMIPTNFAEEEHRLSLLQAVIESLRNCTVELTLPVYVDGVMCEGKPLRQVSYYEHVCTHLCALIASTPASCFQSVENCLVANLLQGDVLTVLLTVDLWTFMARWESADLCAEHVQFLSKLLCRLPFGSIAFSNVSVLVRRLSALMATGHQEMLLCIFPPSKAENVVIWAVLPVDSLPVSVRTKVCRTVVPVCTKYCHSCLTSDKPGLRENIQYLSCLKTVYSIHGVRELITAVHHTAVLNMINTLWSKCIQGTLKECEEVWYEVLDLSSLLLPFVQPEEYAQILRGLRMLLIQFNGSAGMTTAAAQFLGKCGGTEVTPAVETGIFNNLSSLFSTLISDQDWLVHQLSLEAVKTFAEITPYPHIMGDCVPERLLPTLSSFLNQVPFKQEEFSSSTTERDTDILVHQRDLFKVSTDRKSCPGASALNTETTEKQSRSLKGVVHSSDTTDTLEPEAKRMKRDDEDILFHHTEADDTYHKIIETMKSQIASLMTLRSKHPPSQSVVQELCNMQQAIKTFVDSKDSDSV